MRGIGLGAGIESALTASHTVPFHFQVRLPAVNKSSTDGESGKSIADINELLGNGYCVNHTALNNTTDEHYRL